MKLDIYALGIILADLVCNPLTLMETVKIDDALKAKKPVLPKGYKLEGLVEAELLLAMVQPDPEKRPTIDEIKDKWLVKWQESICNEDQKNLESKPFFNLAADKSPVRNQNMMVDINVVLD